MPIAFSLNFQKFFSTRFHLLFISSLLFEFFVHSSICVMRLIFLYFNTFFLSSSSSTPLENYTNTTVNSLSLFPDIWTVGKTKPIKVLSQAPSPVFFSSSNLEPFKIRGDYLTKSIPWSDEVLKNLTHPGEVFSDVEVEHKETRLKYPLKNYNIHEFLEDYRSPGSSLYAVSDIPSSLRHLITLPKVSDLLRQVLDMS